MRNLFKNVAVALLATILLSACAVSPRSSDWTSPKKFTQAQVFNAAALSGGQAGYLTSVIDKDSGSLSFSKAIGDGNMILSVHIATVGGVVRVSSTANYTSLGVAGIHEEEIKKLHAALFRNLNIDQGEMNNVVIQEAK